MENWFLCLKISASKYLFEDTIIMTNLQHVEIPRTVEGFSKLVMGAKTILSWKARTIKSSSAVSAVEQKLWLIMGDTRYSTSLFQTVHSRPDAELWNHGWFKPHNNHQTSSTFKPTKSYNEDILKLWKARWCKEEIGQH